MDIDPEPNNQKAYAWESEYKRSWDILEQDDQGHLLLPQSKKNKFLQEKKKLKVHRGLIRNIVLVIDASRMMAGTEKQGYPSNFFYSYGSEQDFKHESGGGNRLEVVLNMISRSWIQEHFDGNPLSSLSILAMRDGLAERWSDFNTNPTDLIKQISRNSRIPLGDPSLQNALEIARNSLLHLPKHISKEIIILYGSLYTCDPGDIHSTISCLANDGIRVHILGIGAQVKIAETITSATKGEYQVSMDQHHFRECLGKLIQPPPLQTSECEFVQMGFPVVALLQKPGLCACHQLQISSGFVCPKCDSLVCQVPRECPICSLTLCSAPSLARSYHHIFPPQGFQEIQGLKSRKDTITCTGCGISGTTVEVECSGCKKSYCFDCGSFIIEVLHSCPSCSLLSHGY